MEGAAAATRLRCGLVDDDAPPGGGQADGGGKPGKAGANDVDGLGHGGGHYPTPQPRATVAVGRGAQGLTNAWSRARNAGKRNRGAAMRRAMLMVFLCLASGAAAETVPLGADPSECEIQAALLGRAGPDCPLPHRVVPHPPAPVPPPSPAAAAAPPAAPPVAVAVPSPPPLPPRPQALGASLQIVFDFGSARVGAQSQRVLDRVAAAMAVAEEGVRFRIVGHTDAVGSDAANLALSRRRAQAVRDYLVTERGIAPERLETDGQGERQLADPDHPRAEVNRRVEIVNLGP